MNTDKITNWLGVGQAIAIAVVDFYTTSNADGSIAWSSPIFWVGLIVAALVAVKAYYTNKPSVPSA